MCSHALDASEQVRITVKQPWRTVTRQAIRDMSKEEFRELYNVSASPQLGGWPALPLWSCMFSAPPLWPWFFF